MTWLCKRYIGAFVPEAPGAAAWRLLNTREDALSSAHATTETTALLSLVALQVSNTFKTYWRNLSHHIPSGVCFVQHHLLVDLLVQGRQGWWLDSSCTVTKWTLLEPENPLIAYFYNGSMDRLFYFFYTVYDSCRFCNLIFTIASVLCFLTH